MNMKKLKQEYRIGTVSLSRSQTTMVRTNPKPNPNPLPIPNYNLSQPYPSRSGSIENVYLHSDVNYRHAVNSSN